MICFELCAGGLGEAETDPRRRGGPNFPNGGSNARAVIRGADGEEDRCAFLPTDHSGGPWSRRAGAKKWPHPFRTRLRCARSPFESADRRAHEFPAGVLHQAIHRHGDRKSTRLNSSHVSISYAVFCLKKKK